MTSTSSPRIPMALQEIFVASQSGQEVSAEKAPKNGIGFRMFKRSVGGSSSRRSHRSSTRPSRVVAPKQSSLQKERNDGKSVETAAEASRKAMKKKQKEAKQQKLAEDTPQRFLDKMLQERGYSAEKFSSLEGGYYCRPSPYQQASYGICINQAVRSSDTKLLRRLLDAGLSPNPCNSFGESTTHMISRRGNPLTLRIFLEAGCSLQVTDDYGRTPLHDACWKAQPDFGMVELIMSSDIHLFKLLDCRGAAPLSYVKKENYGVWIEFLKSKLDRYWPVRDVALEGKERPPPLTKRQPHSLPIPDPPNALPLDVASLVANGRMEPEEALYLDDDEDDEDDDSSSYDSDDSDYSSSDESDFDGEEMLELCRLAGGPAAVARACFGPNTKVIGKSA